MKKGTWTLNAVQATAAKDALALIRQRITETAQGDKKAEFAIRRYIRIRLEHDERGTPAERKALKKF